MSSIDELKKPKRLNNKTIGVADLGQSSNMRVVTKRKDMNFKVEVDFQKRFKQYALDHDMTLKELLEISFEYYIKNNE